MAYVNVAEWKPEQVCEWLKGLDNCIQPYLHTFALHKINGQLLLNFRPEDLENLGIIKIGHQEIVLAAVDSLRNFHYELDRENLQLLALRLSCKAHSLCNELAKYSSTDTLITTQTLCDVASTITSVKPLVWWMDKPPFNGLLDYNEKKKRLLKVSLEMATCAQRDRFAEKPIEKIQIACKELAQLADYFIQEAMDPMILQPAALDLATLKKPGDDLGFYLQLCFHAHQITEIKFGSPAHQSGKMEEGDEIVQVNYQTVVGWERKNVLALFRENPDEILLTLKRRPRHTKVYGQIYIKPYRLPSNKKIAYSRWHNLPSPRPELLTIPDFVMPRPRTSNFRIQVREPSPEPVSITDTVDIPAMATDSSDSDDSESEPIIVDRLYPSKPRNMIQRRATITGASPTAKYGIEIEQFWRELKKERKSAFPILDKAVSCAQGLNGTPQKGIRVQTYCGYYPRLMKPPSTTYEKRRVQFNDTESDEGKKEDKIEYAKTEQESSKVSLSSPETSAESVTVRPMENPGPKPAERPIVKIIAMFQSNVRDEAPTKISDKPQIAYEKKRNSHDKMANNVERIQNTLEKLSMSQNVVPSKPPSKPASLKKCQLTENVPEKSIPVDVEPNQSEKLKAAKEEKAVAEKLSKPPEKLQTFVERCVTPDSSKVVPSVFEKCDKVFPEVEIVTIKRNESLEDGSESYNKVLQSFDRSSRRKVMTSFGTESPVPGPRYVFSQNEEEKKPRLTPPEPPKRKYFPKTVVSSSEDEDRSPPTFQSRKLNSSHSNISNSSSTSSSASNGVLIERHLWSRKPERNFAAESSSEPRSSRPRVTQRTLFEQYKTMGESPKLGAQSSYKMDRFNTEPNLQSPVTLPRTSDFVHKIKPDEREKVSESGTMNRALSMARNIALHGSSISHSGKSPRSVRKRNTLLTKRRNVSVKDLSPGDMEGWLTYRGKGAGGTWAKAWYVLKYAFLYRFETQDSPKADCLICLTGYTVSQATEIKSRKYAFKVYHTGTVFYFAADSEDLLSTWLDAVNKATLGIEASQGANELYSETDESDSEAKTSKSKSAPPSAEKSSESGFGSLKKFVRRDGTSLDRKYLKFLGSKSRNYPVPTEQFRSYRRVLPSSSSSLNS